jgi:hypothetical protein
VRPPRKIYRQDVAATLVSWNHEHNERDCLPRTSKTRHDALIIVLSFTFVAGMAIALATILIWRSHPALEQGTTYNLAVAFCPPFILVGSVGGITDTTLALVLTSGTIVFANGALYAGLAAFVYWAVTTFWPRAAKR